MFPTTHKFDVYDFLKAGDTEEYNVAPLYTGIDCTVVPASTEILAVYPGVPSYQLFEITTQENITLKNGYKLKQGSEEYIVRETPMKVDNHYMYFIKAIGEQKL